MDKPKLIRKRKDMVIDFCYFNNKLYDCGAYTKILNTLTDEELLTKVLSVFSRCYYKNKVAYSNLGEIYLGDSKVRERLGWTFALRPHNGKLYDAGMYYQVYETLKFFKKKFLEVEKDERYQYEFYRGITSVQPISSWLAQQLLAKTR